MSTYYTRQKAEKKQGHQGEAMKSAPQMPQLLKQIYKIIYSSGIASKHYFFYFKNFNIYQIQYMKPIKGQRNEERQ
jgi:hypothetical protein